MTRCHLCGEDRLALATGIDRLPSVTSDCRPWALGENLCVCRACGLVQKPVDDDFRAELARLYAGYEIYAQGGGIEQVVFDDEVRQPSPRSRSILENVFSTVPLPKVGRWLDIGCGNGAMLRAVAERLPEWQSVGTELDDRHRAIVESIAGVEYLHIGELDRLEGIFDVVSMLHVLEHVEKPAQFLRTIHRFLRPGGLLFIQQPASRGNYFDLIIADHLSHFDEESMALTLHRAGFEAIRVGRQFFDRELFAIARVGDRFSAQDARSGGLRHVELEAQVAWLALVADGVRALGSGCGIFGSSIAATFAYAARQGDVAFFVDEDPNRIGRTHLGVPIIAPTDVLEGAPVYVALPPQVARVVAGRDERNTWILPPAYTGVNV
jgi:SAM-dependent methyltransferase